MKLTPFALLLFAFSAFALGQARPKVEFDVVPDGKIPPLGEPRGHWEGNTFVVEKTNFIGGKLAVSGGAYSEDLKLTERFTRTGPNTLEYSVTVNDPQTCTAPWTARFPLTAESGHEIFEYACHEGNYSMSNRLSAARAEEAREARGKN